MYIKLHDHNSFNKNIHNIYSLHCKLLNMQKMAAFYM